MLCCAVDSKSQFASPASRRRSVNRPVVSASRRVESAMWAEFAMTLENRFAILWTASATSSHINVILLPSLPARLRHATVYPVLRVRTKRCCSYLLCFEKLSVKVAPCDALYILRLFTRYYSSCFCDFSAVVAEFPFLSTNLLFQLYAFVCLLHLYVTNRYNLHTYTSLMVHVFSRNISPFWVEIKTVNNSPYLLQKYQKIPTP